MHYLYKALLTSPVVLFPLLGTANVDIKFQESAPKDRFTITNTSDCTLQNLLVTFDLTKTAGQLIFDTTADGEGVEVFQPFESRSNKMTLSQQAAVRDGQRSLTVDISELPPVSSVSFTIDVDDTLPQSELGMIRVAGSEMVGAIVSIDLEGAEGMSAVFDATSTASIPLSTCIE